MNRDRVVGRVQKAVALAILFRHNHDPHPLLRRFKWSPLADLRPESDLSIATCAEQTHDTRRAPLMRRNGQSIAPLFAGIQTGRLKLDLLRLQSFTRARD